MAEEILFEKRADGVALVTLNRPQALNALDRAMVRHLRQVLRAAEDDPAVGVILMAGAGGKAFCVGVDLKERQTLSDDEAHAFRMGEMFPLYRELEEKEKPSIALVDGHCLGGGFELALTCDLMLATPHSSFGFPEVKWGIIPSAGGARKLPKLVGMAKAKEMILTGQPIKAPEALALGLLNRVVEAPALLDQGLAMAGLMLTNVGVAVRAAKRAIDQSLDFARTRAFDIEASTACYTAKERKDAVKAFEQKKGG